MVNITVTKGIIIDEGGVKGGYAIVTDGPVDLIHKNGVLYGSISATTEGFDEVKAFLRYLIKYNPNPEDITIRFRNIPRSDCDEVFGHRSNHNIENRLRDYF